MNCPKCGEEFVVDTLVKVWQRARGVWEGDTYYATDYETFWDSEEEIKKECMCPRCDHTQPFPSDVKFEWS